MLDKIFILSRDEELRTRIANALPGTGSVVFIVQDTSELSGYLKPQDHTLVLVGIEDDQLEEGYRQLTELQKRYPAAQILLLPSGASENFEFAIVQAIKVMQIKSGDFSDQQPEKDR